MEGSEIATLDQWESSLFDDDVGDVTDAETTAEPASEPETTDKPPASEDAPAEDPEVSPAAQTDDGEQPDDDETPTDEVVEPVEAAAQPAPEAPTIETKPFHIRVDGKDLELPGAVESSNGLRIIPVDTWNRQIQPRLADRMALKKAHEAEVASVRAEKNLEVVRASAILKKVDALLDSQEAFEAFVEDFDRSKKLLSLEVDAEVNAWERDQKRTVETAQQERDSTETLTRNAQSTLEQGVDIVLQDAEFAGLGLDRTEMLGTLWDLRASLYREATAHDVGHEPGEIILDLNRMRRVLQPAARAAALAKQNTAQVNTAREKNTQALRKSSAPPAVASRGAPAVGGRADKVPQTREEWEDSLLS